MPKKKSTTSKTKKTTTRKRTTRKPSTSKKTTTSTPKVTKPEVKEEEKVEEPVEVDKEVNPNPFNAVDPFENLKDSEAVGEPDFKEEFNKVDSSVEEKKDEPYTKVEKDSDIKMVEAKEDKPKSSNSGREKRRRRLLGFS